MIGQNEPIILVIHNPRCPISHVLKFLSNILVIAGCYHILELIYLHCVYTQNLVKRNRGVTALYEEMFVTMNLCGETVLLFSVEVIGCSKVRTNEVFPPFIILKQIIEFRPPLSTLYLLVKYEIKISKNKIKNKKLEK